MKPEGQGERPKESELPPDQLVRVVSRAADVEAVSTRSVATLGKRRFGLRQLVLGRLICISSGIEDVSGGLTSPVTTGKRSEGGKEDQTLTRGARVAGPEAQFPACRRQFRRGRGSEGVEVWSLGTADSSRACGRIW